MLNFFAQRLIHPFISLNNLHMIFLDGLDVSEKDKEYLSDFLILNVFFDCYQDLWRNLGLSYHTAKQYFLDNDDFLVIKDDNRSLYYKAKLFINEKFNNYILKVPLVLEKPDKKLIITDYNDLFNPDKVVNTAIYLTLKYAKFNSSSISFDIKIPSSVGFLGP